VSKGAVVTCLCFKGTLKEGKAPEKKMTRGLGFSPGHGAPKKNKKKQKKKGIWHSESSSSC